MQKEIDEIKTTRDIDILGVNQVHFDSGNAMICDGRDLPWLQEGEDHSIWTSWDVVYRDVIILDDENVVIDAFNLTEKPLTESANYEALKQFLLEAAQ